jgi:hypothetical protein
MKNLLSLFLISFSWPLCGYEVTVRVVDDAGVAVAGSDVGVVFGSYGSEDINKGKSDKDGLYRATGRGNHSVMINVVKSGYYPAQLEGLSRDKDHDVEVVLPRILNPVSLYALRNVSLKFPVQSEWIGFDFEAADWVAPYGKGKTIDILFRFRSEFKGLVDRIRSQEDMEKAVKFSKEMYQAARMEWTMDKFRVDYGKWDAVMEVSFSVKEEGIYETSQFLKYSQLKMPHSAPTVGYVPSWRYEGRSYKAKAYREDVGYFLRTRVRLDRDGNIASANYARIMGDFLVATKGGQVAFTYYFNPLSNDRNLEFDPKKNLFPKDKPGANVYDP